MTDIAGELDAVLTETEHIDGGLLLDEMRHWLGRFICTVADADLDILTLWAAHTHVAHETYTTPRLVLDSPVPGSGKTTCLEHLQRLCLRPVQIATLSSPALLTRMLAVELRTLLIDEADRSLSPEKDGIADLLAVLNSGYKRGATRPVLTPGKSGQWEVSEMPTFAPVAMAGNNPQLPEDTRSRSIRVLLLPDLEDVVEESDWELIEGDANALHARLTAWCDQIRDHLLTNRPGLPDGIKGRFREKWSPLKRVAAEAGGRWPAAVDVMAEADREQWEMDREDGLIRERPAVVLLAHIYARWPDDEAFLTTETLITRLINYYPETWGAESTYGRDLTPQRMGRMLVSAYKINSTRESANGHRGYRRATFAGVWSRMRVTPPNKPAEPAQPAQPALVEPVEPAKPVEPVTLTGVPLHRCDICGQPLAAAAMDGGHTTHPNCQVAA